MSRNDISKVWTVDENLEQNWRRKLLSVADS